MKDYWLKLLPEAQTKCLKTAELVCERCKKRFVVPFWMVKKGRRFCKASCRKANPLDTLLSRIEKQKSGCWNYTGVIGWGGYGQIKVGSTTHSAHRLMWILWNKKPVPDGHVVRHTCIGNRKCINPDHLITGTQRDNIHDMIRQGRFRIATGIERGCAALTEDQVRQIRKLRGPGLATTSPNSYKSIADKFGVSMGIVWQVIQFKTYKNVKP